MGRIAMIPAVLLPLSALLLIAQTGTRTRAAGYLSSAPDLNVILPAAPETGSPRDRADRAIFKMTRAFKDSPRWTLAQNDDRLSVEALLADFSCATGAGLSPSIAPVLAHLVERVSRDAGDATGPPKDFFHRKRPFLVDSGPVCITVTPAFEKTWDYPSGHTTISWALGLILAELVPDHATAILTRARAFGESRIVCGVHNASAVEAGRISGAAVVAALHANPDFQSDLEKARAEWKSIQSRTTLGNPGQDERDSGMIPNGVPG